MAGSPSKRRHVSSDPRPWKKRREDHGENEDEEMNETSTNDINSVIARLALPDEKIQVAVDHANYLNSNNQVQAYAKLAGPTWTYYVQTLKVVIGRSSEPLLEGQQPEVQIDLGPAKVVSRKHACIQYNGSYWELAVLGRNGVRVDTQSYKQDVVRLHSGNVIDIGGVQMMFVLPDTPPEISPRILKKLGNKRATTSSSVNTSVASVSTKTFDSPKKRSTKSSQGEPRSPLNSPSHHPHHHEPQDMVIHHISPRESAETSSSLYPKGVAIITRPQVRGVNQAIHYVDQDLSTDDAKDIKPPYSYAVMISQAILSTKEMMMSLSEIYNWISTQYSFYRHSKTGWQNSIRHNLSLNKAFEKVPRRADEPGKGMKWRITPQFRDEFMRKISRANLLKGSGGIEVKMDIRSKSQPTPVLLPPTHEGLAQGPQGQPLQPPHNQPPHNQPPHKQPLQPAHGPQFHVSIPPNGPLRFPPPVSLPGSTSAPGLAPGPAPAPPVPPAVAAQPSLETIEEDKRSRDFMTPQKLNQKVGSGQYMESIEQYNPNTAIPTQTHQQQPTEHQYNGTQVISQLEAYTPDRGSNTGGRGARQGSASKTNTMFGMSNTPLNRNLSQTPAPQATHLQLAPPTSAQQQQLPSSFMPGSSPAPFWKLMQLGSTPVRGSEFSPTKFSSPPVAAECKNTDGSDDGLGDLQDVDLTRGFPHIGNWRDGGVPSGDRTPEKLKS